MISKKTAKKDKKKIRKCKNQGITLIALIITIVLIILAGVSIATLTGDNGILTRTNDAKVETALGSVKEALKLEQGEKRIEDKELTPEILLAEGKVTRTVQQKEDEKYYMYYAIKEKAFEGMQGLGKGNLSELKEVFLIDDNLNVRYIASNGKEYGDNIEEKILDDETEIRFSSKAFSEYISKISGVKEEDMKFKWMKNQKSLTIADSSVDSLQDLVFFPNLEKLTLGDWENNIPPITSMDGIENCIKLTTLNIIDGPDKDYSSLAKLPNLTTFYRNQGNDFDNIIDSIKECKSLQSFSIQNQKFTSMKRISELNDLRILSLANCPIEKIEGLENHHKLEELVLNTTNISRIEGLDNLVNLKKLQLVNNNITDITPLNKNTSLIYLDLRGNKDIDGNRNNYIGEKLEDLNKIGEILDRGGTINVDIDKLGLFTNYTKLDLTNQNLTTIEPLEGLNQLVELNLSNNKLTLEDNESQEILKKMTNLKFLNLSNNKITNIESINTLKNLSKLYLSGNYNINLKEIEDIISNLSEIRVSTQSLKTINNCDINKIKTLNLINSALTELPDLSKFTKLTTLDVSSNPNISNIDIISNISNLQTLNLVNTNLHGRMIEFSKLTNLTVLNLASNTLWSEDLENLKTLQNNSKLSINLSNNSIIDATNLLVLNPNTIINLSRNINLSQDSKDKLKSRFGSSVSF